MASMWTWPTRSSCSLRVTICSARHGKPRATSTALRSVIEGVRYESTSTASSPPPLPPIHPRVLPPDSPSPIPWLSLAHVDEYLKPLRRNIPWWFGIDKETFANKRPGQSAPGWSYHAEYSFTSAENSKSFVSIVDEILSSEGIPRLTDFAHNVLKRETNAVQLHVQTSNAYIPEEIWNVRPNVPARDATPFPASPLIVPGLTIRDVRLAMLIDEMFKKQYLEPGLGIHFMPNSSMIVYPSAKEMVGHIFRRGFCPCCGLPHLLSECEKRHSYTPKESCKWCGEDHWTSDCQLAREARIEKRRPKPIEHRNTRKQSRLSSKKETSSLEQN